MCNNNGNCMASLLEKILLLQKMDLIYPNGCSNPILGSNVNNTANTRPLNLYCCCSNSIWNITYNYNGETGTTNIFRVESINENTATFRLLVNTNNVITATDNFITFDLNHISCIKCLQDVRISNLE